MLSAIRTNPFRAANWRWQRVIGALDQTQPLPSRRRDSPIGYKWIREGMRFKILHDRSLNDPAMQYVLLDEQPAIFWAHWLYSQANNSSRYSIEAYILSRQTDFEIGFQCGVPPAIIDAYEALFFNVREKLNHPDYIVNCVIGQAIHRGLAERDFDLLSKLYGYFCGHISSTA